MKECRSLWKPSPPCRLELLLVFPLWLFWPLAQSPALACFRLQKPSCRGPFAVEQSGQPQLKIDDDDWPLSHMQTCSLMLQIPMSTDQEVVKEDRKQSSEGTLWWLILVYITQQRPLQYIFFQPESTRRCWTAPYVCSTARSPLLIAWTPIPASKRAVKNMLLHAIAIAFMVERKRFDGTAGFFSLEMLGILLQSFRCRRRKAKDPSCESQSCFTFNVRQRLGTIDYFQRHFGFLSTLGINGHSECPLIIHQTPYPIALLPPKKRNSRSEWKWHWML